MFLRTGRLDIDFGVVSSPLPHTGVLGGWCFGGRTEEGGVKLGVEAEGVRGQRVTSRVERHGDDSGTDSGEMRAILPAPLSGNSPSGCHGEPWASCRTGPRSVCFLFVI